MTLVELLIGMVIIVILATIGITVFQNQREKVKLVKCMAEIRGIQAAVMSMGDGRYIPTPQTFWESAFPDGRRHGPYYYITDGDPNEGHGNDLDGVDETNPGVSDPDKKDIKFVIFCEHDHKHLGKYVYLTDEEPPTIATDENDPGYTKFIKWEFGGPGAKTKK
jgi:type II secretory pathway pseudopilin PulG